MQRSEKGRELGATELALLLALVRGGNLAAAAQLAGVDASTVFRTVQRAERALGQRLFERSRAGYRATSSGSSWPNMPSASRASWMLTHPESRHLRRIRAVGAHLAQTVELA